MLKKFRTSGYLKSSLISLAIILAAVGVVVGLDWRDKAAAAALAAEQPDMGNMQTEGMRPGGGTTRGTPDGAATGDAASDGAMPTGDVMQSGMGADDQAQTAEMQPPDGGTAPPQQTEGANSAATDETSDVRGAFPAQSDMSEEQVIALLDQAVASGRMTREAADAALEAFQNGEGFAMPFGGEGGSRPEGDNRFEGGTPPEGGMRGAPGDAESPVQSAPPQTTEPTTRQGD